MLKRLTKELKGSPAEKELKHMLDFELALIDHFINSGQMKNVQKLRDTFYDLIENELVGIIRKDLSKQWESIKAGNYDLEVQDWGTFEESQNQEYEYQSDSSRRDPAITSTAEESVSYELEYPSESLLSCKLKVDHAPLLTAISKILKSKFKLSISPKEVQKINKLYPYPLNSICETEMEDYSQQALDDLENEELYDEINEWLEEESEMTVRHDEAEIDDNVTSEFSFSWTERPTEVTSDKNKSELDMGFLLECEAKLVGGDW